MSYASQILDSYHSSAFSGRPLNPGAFLGAQVVQQMCAFFA